MQYTNEDFKTQYNTEVKTDIQKHIQSYDFEIIGHYYDYIIESKINGQIQQAKKLIFELPNPFKADFAKYVYHQLNDNKDAVLCADFALSAIIE